MGLKNSKPRFGESPKQHGRPPFKIMTMGDKEVGKTSLIKTFVSESTKTFRTQYKPTIGCDFQVYSAAEKLFDVSPGTALQIWDTAGNERFASLGMAFFRGADAVVIMFDVTCRSSFDTARGCPALAIQFGVSVGTQAFLLVGNKNDCSEEDRVVDAFEGVALAEELGLLGYVECSAKTAEGVNDVFKYVSEGPAKWLGCMPSDARAVPSAEAVDGPTGSAEGAAGAAVDAAQLSSAPPAAPLGQSQSEARPQSKSSSSSDDEA